MTELSLLPRASHSNRSRRAWITVAVCVAVACILQAQAPGDSRDATTEMPAIVPTAHLPIPSTAADAWIVPDQRAVVPAAWRQLGQAARAIAEGAPSEALRAIDVAALANTPLAAHARYYQGPRARGPRSRRRGGAGVG